MNKSGLLIRLAVGFICGLFNVVKNNGLQLG